MNNLEKKQCTSLLSCIITICEQQLAKNPRDFEAQNLKTKLANTVWHTSKDAEMEKAIFETIGGEFVEKQARGIEAETPAPVEDAELAKAKHIEFCNRFAEAAKNQPVQKKTEVVVVEPTEQANEDLEVSEFETLIEELSKKAPSAIKATAKSKLQNACIFLGFEFDSENKEQMSDLLIAYFADLKNKAQDNETT